MGIKVFFLDALFLAMALTQTSTKHLHALLMCCSLLFTAPTVAAQTFLEEAKSIVDTLASPHFDGRGYVNNGDSLAAAYIANKFREAGVSPLLDTYYQHFSLTPPLFYETPKLSLNGMPLRPGLDFLPYASSPSVVSANQAPIIYAGTGLYHPPSGINAYANLSAANAIVVVNDAVPDSMRLRSGIPSEFFSRALRAEVAALHSAEAVLFVTDSPLMYGGDFRKIPIPAFVVRRDVWPDHVSSITYAIQNKLDVEVSSSNVIAYQPGTRYPDRYIVVMGHYDHLGRLGPEVYFPGANDNASGIALILNLASYFQKNPPAYSVVYIAFSGEEQGLLGSKYFVENSPFSFDQVRFLINLDMVASGKQGLMALGGVEFAEEFDVLSALNDSLRIGPLSKRPNAPNSDHYFFLEKGIRGFFIYTNKGTQPYHHVNDLPETLDWAEYKDTYLLVRHFIEALR